MYLEEEVEEKWKIIVHKIQEVVDRYVPKSVDQQNHGVASQKETHVGISRGDDNGEDEEKSF